MELVDFSAGATRHEPANFFKTKLLCSFQKKVELVPLYAGFCGLLRRKAALEGKPKA